MKIEIKTKMKMRIRNVYRNIFVEHISDFIELDIFIWMSKEHNNNKYPTKIHENLPKKSLQDRKIQRQQRKKEMKKEKWFV